MPRNQILVIRGGAIGDFIVTLPVFAALREMFPESRLETVAYSGVAQLAVEGGLVDENLQSNIKRVCEAQFIQGPHRPDETQPIHATESLLKPLERLAIFSPDAVPKLKLKEAESLPKATGEKWLALHPGSGSERKNWPLASWLAFIKKLLVETSWKLLVIGGEADGQRLEAIQKLLPVERGMILRNAPLTSVAQALQRCDLYIGHDSGISHLAAAAGVPGVLLWGPSNQQVWGPRSEKVKVIHAGTSLDSLAIELVWGQLIEHIKR